MAFWTDKNTEAVEDLYLVMTNQRKATLRATAAMLFANIKLLGLDCDSLPNTIGDLNRTDCAKFLQLALHIEAQAQLMCFTSNQERYTEEG